MLFDFSALDFFFQEQLSGIKDFLVVEVFSGDFEVEVSHLFLWLVLLLCLLVHSLCLLEFHSLLDCLKSVLVEVGSECLSNSRQVLDMDALSIGILESCTIVLPDLHRRGDHCFCRTLNEILPNCEDRRLELRLEYSFLGKILPLVSAVMHPLGFLEILFRNIMTSPDLMHETLGLLIRDLLHDHLKLGSLTLLPDFHELCSLDRRLFHHTK